MEKWVTGRWPQLYDGSWELQHLFQPSLICCYQLPVVDCLTRDIRCYQLLKNQTIIIKQLYRYWTPQ